LKTITIRGIDNKLDQRLKKAAKKELLSVNQFLLTTLRKVMGLEKDNTHTKEYHDLDFIFGKWTDAEFEKFEKSQAGFEKIDEEMWK